MYSNPNLLMLRWFRAFRPSNTNRGGRIHRAMLSQSALTTSGHSVRMTMAWARSAASKGSSASQTDAGNWTRAVSLARGVEGPDLRSLVNQGLY